GLLLKSSFEQVAWERGPVAALHGISLRVRSVPLDEDGAIVECHDLIGGGTREQVRDTIFGRQGNPPTEYEVLGRQRRAVMPGEARSKAVRRLHPAIGENSPAIRIELGPALHEVWLRHRALVGHEQARIEEAYRVARYRAGSS